MENFPRNYPGNDAWWWLVISRQLRPASGINRKESEPCDTERSFQFSRQVSSEAQFETTRNFSRNFSAQIAESLLRRKCSVIFPSPLLRRHNSRQIWLEIIGLWIVISLCFSFLCRVKGYTKRATWVSSWRIRVAICQAMRRYWLLSATNLNCLFQPTWVGLTLSLAKVFLSLRSAEKWFFKKRKNGWNLVQLTNFFWQFSLARPVWDNDNIYHIFTDSNMWNRLHVVTNTTLVIVTVVVRPSFPKMTTFISFPKMTTFICAFWGGWWALFLL